MNWYTNLPEWVRWILCWPASVLFSYVVGWLFFVKAVSYVGSWDWTDDLLYPVVTQTLFLGALYYTVPRAKIHIVLVFIIIRSALVLLFVVFTAIQLFEVLPGLDRSQLGWATSWSPLIGEGITFVASLALLAVLRQETAESAASTSESGKH